MNKCDIIIPTYNGCEKLRVALSALLNQDIPRQWSARVILVDDGSTEDVASLIRGHDWIGSWESPLIIRTSRGGRAHARNIGITNATADIILFLADDMILRQGALKEHMAFHTIRPEVEAAALGCIVWDPRIAPTPLMEWMTHGGQQNDYDALLGRTTCLGRDFFYGSFVSVKRSFLGGERFSEEFSQYGWEDLEFGKRLDSLGLILHILHNSLALHRHFYVAKDILHRQRIVGSAKYRVNTNSIRRLRHALYGALGIRGLARYFMEKWGDILNIPRIFAIINAGEFWHGVHHANKLLKSEKK